MLIQILVLVPLIVFITVLERLDKAYHKLYSYDRFHKTTANVPNQILFDQCFMFLF